MEDSSIVITGDYLIITKDGVSNNTKETISKIYNLSEIDSYRLYND